MARNRGRCMVPGSIQSCPYTPIHHNPFVSCLFLCSFPLWYAFFVSACVGVFSVFLWGLSLREFTFIDWDISLLLFIFSRLYPWHDTFKLFFFFLFFRGARLWLIMTDQGREDRKRKEKGKKGTRNGIWYCFRIITSRFFLSLQRLEGGFFLPVLSVSYLNCGVSRLSCSLSWLRPDTACNKFIMFNSTWEGRRRRSQTGSGSG